MSNFAIPGFMVPETPKNDERIFATPDGTIIWDVMPAPDDRQLPVFDFELSLFHRGKDMRRLVIDQNQITLMNIANELGSRIIRAVIPASCVAIEPGTFRLEAFMGAGRQRVAEKWVTVEPSVVNEAVLQLNQLHDCPTWLKPDTSS